LLGGSTDPAGFAGALSAILADDMREELSQIETETLILWGRRDGVITWRDGVRLLDALPNAQLLVVRNAAHVLMVEHPEWFDNTASEFLLG
jgi:pimeloyl-ACP methyl ester carboxylesterase